MNVPLSISNSNQRLPQANWLAILAAAGTLLLAFIGLMEYQLARRGFESTVLDSRELWLQQRQRASDLGSNALILIGGSRIQLGVDLDLLRQNSPLEPVQLAIDGSSFLPILQGLAEDPSITGTLVVDYMDHLIAEERAPDRANEYQSYYQQQPNNRLITSATTEAFFSQWRNRLLRSYADGARPISSLLARILVAKPAHQYLTTLADRSRKADYQLVTMPDFYYQRALRNLGNPDIELPPNATYQDLDLVLQQKITALKPSNTEYFIQMSQQIAVWVKRIQDRGGKVVFVVLPASGLIRQIEQQRYPQTQFWQRFTELNHANYNWHFSDQPNTQTLQCPDGSHLDYRQRHILSQSLIQALNF